MTNRQLKNESHQKIGFPRVSSESAEKSNSIQHIVITCFLDNERKQNQNLILLVLDL